MLRPSIHQIKSITILHIAFLLLMSSSLSAVANNTINHNMQNIPQSLNEWVPWVLKDQPDIRCPIIYNNNKHFCAYAAILSINIEKNKAVFLQNWDIYAPSLIPLPGDEKHWPLNVRVNDQLYPVIARQGRPFIQLEQGHYSIEGNFSWQQIPQFLSIANETGLINLTINNRAMNKPDFRNGKLWLKTSTQSKHQNNRLDLHVFRKLTDSIPLKIETMIKLDVSGQQRELILSGALLKNFTASALNSKLPAQIDKQGNLKIQLRAGQWQIKLTSFHAKEIHSIPLTEFATPWPNKEIWVLDQQTHLRRIIVIGRSSIDAKQTQLPQLWKKYPAFQMQSGQQMDFKIVKRGDPEPQPDQLKLSKKIWLDFDGKGLTINDKISGQLSQQWRLNSSADIILGQVTLNGVPQYITRSDDQLQGVEVRHGKINLSSDSRINSGQRTIPSSGWEVDFNHVDASLYLPAGWKLFSLSGAEASGTWLKQWTLLDLFIVLITAIAIFKLWGILWGLLALVTLALIWHQPNAPQYIWINLIIATALLRALPTEGRIFKWIRNYRFYVLLFLVIIIVPFIINQARIALYPQLEFHSIGHSYNYKQDSNNSIAVDKQSRKMQLSSYLSEAKSPTANKSKIGRQMESIDPDAMIQTGPGLPSWTLNQYRIQWNGPVNSQQNISMVLISPAVNSLLNVLRIVFILLLSWRLLDLNRQQISKVFSTAKIPSATQALAMIFSLLLTSIVLLAPATSEASLPSKALLDELKTELIKPAQCLPQCASIESININLSSNRLTMKLLVHAQQDVSIPLPIPIKQWLPHSILIDDQAAQGLFRQNTPVLWMFIKKGSHSIEIDGKIDYLDHLQISFPLKPHHLTLNVDAWSTEGMDNDITKISALSFLRTNNEHEKLIKIDHGETGQGEIPVFAQITRTLNLGQSWNIETQVHAISGNSYPIIFKIPLLAGESILSDNIKVENNHAIITLKQKNARVQWYSKLNITNNINLKAIDSSQIIEQWILNTSPIWHVEHSGIPVIYHQRHGNLWQPRWQPWSGEEVHIEVTHPKGIKGNTITIDSSTLKITPGEQNTKSELEFNLRSSLGGQHNIYLPENSVLQTLSINNKNYPIHNSQQGLSLPILPGKQKIKVTWNEVRGVSNIFHSSALNLGIESVNNKITLIPGSSRWVLLTTGPAMGPAVLFWGVFFIIIILSIAIGRIKGTPLSTLQWILLWIGLSASEPYSVILIVACIFALKARHSIDVKNMRAISFNLFQLALIILVISSISALIVSIQQGLLGSPSMQISGNGSSAYQLNWFSDRIAQELPQATMISVPVYIYRLFMLLWSIWLAFAVIKWAQWGWSAFVHQEYWKPLKLKLKTHEKSGIWGNKKEENTLIIYC